jgi:TolB-like protein
VKRRLAVLLAAAVLALGGLVACGNIENTVGPMEETSEYAELGNLVHALPGMGNASGLEVHAVRSSKTVIIHKIAVMPLIEIPDKIEGELAQGATEAVSAELYARATIDGGWNVVPQDDVADMMQQMPPSTEANDDQNALELGRRLGVDGVLYGSVHRYRERVGYDYAAQTPAAVAFTLNFVDEHSKQIIWTANFAKEQKSLSDNVLDLPSFLSNAGRWVRAHDLAAQGAQEAVANLQSKITVQPIVEGQY